MAQPGGTTAGAVAAQLASYTVAPAGGWCTFLGKPAGSPLTQQDAQAIFNKTKAAIDGGQGVYGLLPPNLNPYMQMALAEETAIAKRLSEWVAAGTPCDQIPNNLHDDPSIGAAAPTTPGQVIGNAFNVLVDWTGLGDIVVKGAVLVGIVVLALIAVRRLI